MKKVGLVWTCQGCSRPDGYRDRLNVRPALRHCESVCPKNRPGASFMAGQLQGEEGARFFPRLIVQAMGALRSPP
jgi:hypothetical protein